MRATFVGHQTWLLEHHETRILVDPLICPDFGLVDGHRIDIYPPRSVDAQALQDIDAIFLSHEHGDHFDIDSLNLLPRTAKFFVGCTVVEPVKACIRALGFDLIEVVDTAPQEIGSVSIRFYPADPRTAFWESRVTQIYLEEAGNPRGGVFIAVDALVSEKFKEDVAEGVVNEPRLVVVANNCRISPPGAFQSLENWADNGPDNNKKRGPLGAGVLASVLVSYLDDFPVTPKNIAMCGGGFVKRYDGFAAFPFSEQPLLADIANRLSLDVNVLGLLPGQTIDMSGESTTKGITNWIKVDEIQHKIFLDELAEFMSSDKELQIASSVLPDFENAVAYETALARAENELSAIAKSIFMFPTGKISLELTEYRQRPLGRHRVAFAFRCNSLSKYALYALNIHTGSFDRLEVPASPTIYDLFPFGVEMPLVDFLGMADGDVQIWDLVGASIKSWFVRGIFDGIIPFFYSYYGENASPELLQRVINVKLEKLGIGRIEC